MRIAVRTGLMVVGVALGALLTPQAAHAQDDPTITVTPSSGLRDGQTVTVSGAGFDPGAVRWPGTVCRAEVLALLPSTVDINSLCGAASLVQVTPNATGAFSTPMVVFQVQRTFLGGAIDCGQSDCVVLFLELVGPAQQLTGSAAARISFGPDVPTTKAQCKNGGWRNLANDQGQSFRNQGGCVSSVASQK
jgi:hypothetical protein